MSERDEAEELATCLCSFHYNGPDGKCLRCSSTADRIRRALRSRDEEIEAKDRALMEMIEARNKDDREIERLRQREAWWRELVPLEVAYEQMMLSPEGFERLCELRRALGLEGEK